MSMVRMIVFVVSSCFVFVMCDSFSRKEVKNIKDLDENMIDLRMYHENLGDAILKKDQDNGMWLGTGLDSVLKVVAGKFDEHRKLRKPFMESYRNDLEPSLKKMNFAIEQKAWHEAEESYTLLTKKCNGCHKDLDVDKEVQNWLQRKH